MQWGYLKPGSARRMNTNRLAKELSLLSPYFSYSLGTLSGSAAAGNERVWIVGPESTKVEDTKAIELVEQQAARRRIRLVRP
jgi:hypothetical protein